MTIQDADITTRDILGARIPDKGNRGDVGMRHLLQANLAGRILSIVVLQALTIEGTLPYGHITCLRHKRDVRRGTRKELHEVPGSIACIDADSTEQG